MGDMENVEADEHILKEGLSNLAISFISVSDKSFETITLGCHFGFLASSTETLSR